MTADKYVAEVQDLKRLLVCIDSDNLKLNEKFPSCTKPLSKSVGMSAKGH